jgi:hypothetical protein
VPPPDAELQKIAQEANPTSQEVLAPNPPLPPGEISPSPASGISTSAELTPAESSAQLDLQLDPAAPNEKRV